MVDTHREPPAGDKLAKIIPYVIGFAVAVVVVAILAVVTATLMYRDSVKKQADELIFPQRTE